MAYAALLADGSVTPNYTRANKNAHEEHVDLLRANGIRVDAVDPANMAKEELEQFMTAQPRPTLAEAFLPAEPTLTTAQEADMTRRLRARGLGGSIPIEIRLRSPRSPHVRQFLKSPLHKENLCPPSPVPCPMPTSRQRQKFNPLPRRHPRHHQPRPTPRSSTASPLPPRKIPRSPCKVSLPFGNLSSKAPWPVSQAPSVPKLRWWFSRGCCRSPTHGAADHPKPSRPGRPSLADSFS